MDKFDQWCVVEVMGHKKFAGRVTEGPFGLVQVDVPEVTLASGQTLPAFSKLFGAASIYCLTVCTEETARAFARDFRTQAFQTYELPALTASKPVTIDASDPKNWANNRDPEWDADNDDLEADWDQPRKCDCGDRQVCDVCQNVGSDPLSDRKLEEELPEALRGSWPAIRPQQPMTHEDDGEPF